MLLAATRRGLTTTTCGTLASRYQRHEVFLDVVVEPGVDGRRNGMVHRAHEQRVAVGRSLRGHVAPSVPPAPPRLSMMSDWFVSRENCPDSGRANASVPPPAGNGTIIVTGFVGQPCWARAAPRRTAAPAAATQDVAALKAGCICLSCLSPWILPHHAAVAGACGRRRLTLRWDFSLFWSSRLSTSPDTAPPCHPPVSVRCLSKALEAVEVLTVSPWNCLALGDGSPAQFRRSTRKPLPR